MGVRRTSVALAEVPAGIVPGCAAQRDPAGIERDQQRPAQHARQGHWHHATPLSAGFRTRPCVPGQEQHADEQPGPSRGPGEERGTGPDPQRDAAPATGSEQLDAEPRNRKEQQQIRRDRIDPHGASTADQEGGEDQDAPGRAAGRAGAPDEDDGHGRDDGVEQMRQGRGVVPGCGGKRQHHGKEQRVGRRPVALDETGGVAQSQMVGEVEVGNPVGVEVATRCPREHGHEQQHRECGDGHGRLGTTPTDPG